MKTRAQNYSKQVYQQISALNFNDEQKKLYGSICHQFPIMVLRSGLAQSVAFLWVKAKSGEDEAKKSEEPTKNKKMAYKCFLQHLSFITGHANEQPKDFQQRIHQMELDEYRRTTRTILSACIWYKRFAESLLNVCAGEVSSDD